MKKIYPIMAISAVCIGVLAVAYLGLRLVMYGISYDRSPGSGNYDPNNPGFEYAPEGDMYHSIPYDGQTQYYEDTMHNNRNARNPYGMNMRLPVAGTVARGQVDYIYNLPNTPAGYDNAKALVNPVPATPENMAEGKKLFNVYCWHCHGHLGEGDGPVMASGKFPKPSWITYKSEYIKNLPAGNMFHTITYGKNLMGAHGTILNPQQRWKIINYIKFLSAQGAATSPTGTTPAATDSAKKVMAAADTTKIKK